MGETIRTTFVFSFSLLSLRHNVSDKFHCFYHFEFHQLFLFVRVPCLNLGIESEYNKHTFYAVKFCRFLVEVLGFGGMGYMVSRVLKYVVQSFSLLEPLSFCFLLSTRL